MGGRRLRKARWESLGRKRRSATQFGKRQSAVAAKSCGLQLQGEVAGADSSSLSPADSFSCERTLVELLASSRAWCNLGEQVRGEGAWGPCILVKRNPHAASKTEEAMAAPIANSVASLSRPMAFMDRCMARGGGTLCVRPGC